MKAPLLALFVLAACAGPSVPSTGCQTDADCAAGRICVANACEKAAAAPVGHLVLSPSSVSVSGVVGSPGTASFVVSNDGTGPLQFTVSCTGGAVPSPAAGALQPGDDGAVDVALPAWTAAGTDSLTCAVAAGDASLTFTVKATVAPAPVGHLTLSPASASTAVTVNTAGASSFIVGNDGHAPLPWTASCDSGATAAPSGGTLAVSEQRAVQVALPPFANTGDFTVLCTSGALTFTLHVSVKAGAVGLLQLSPAASALSAHVGEAGQGGFTVSNGSAAAGLSFAISCTGSATPTPASGTLAASESRDVSVQFATWTTAGTQSVSCTATTSDGAGGPLSWVATVTVTNPPVGHLTLTPTAISLPAQVSQASFTIFTLGNDGTAALHATVSCTSGATPSPASVAIDAGHLEDIAVTIPGFDSAGPQTVTCTATPTDTGGAALTFTATVNVSTVTSESPCANGNVWSDLDSLSGSDLRTALYNRIKGHTALGYNLARDKMFGSAAAPGFDARNGLIESIYSGIQVAPDGTHTPGGFNTEHTWPQSFFNSNDPMVSDLHHLFPTDETSNGRRSNYPFDNVSASITWTSASVCSTTYCSAGGVSELGSDGSTVTFEVRQKQRGDTARAMFYFATRYPDQVGTHFPSFEQAALRAWSAADPPDQFECERNDAIEALQHNRNPFVDRPDFLAKIPNDF